MKQSTLIHKSNFDSLEAENKLDGAMIWIKIIGIALILIFVIISVLKIMFHW